MELVVSNKNDSESKGHIVVADQVFSREFKEPLVHQVVTAYLSGGRLGTKAQKTRAQVRGGGKKPWKQKGTGSARAGTIRSPLWRGGGVVFAATPRSFKQKVNRKMYKIAMSCILSELVRQNRLQVVEDFTVTQPKTKNLISQLKDYQINDKIPGLIIVEELNRNLHLAARNVSYLSVCEARRIDPVSLINHEKVIITKQAVNKINEALL